MLRLNRRCCERIQTPDLYCSDCYASIKVNGLHRPNREIRWNRWGVNDLRDQFDFVLEGNAEVELVLKQHYLKDKTIRCKGVCFVRVPTYPVRSEEAKALREMIEDGDYSNSFSGKARWEIADPKEVSSAYAKLGCNDTEWILTIYGNYEPSWVVRNFWKNIPEGLKYFNPDLCGYAVDVIVDESVIQEINEWSSRGSERNSEPLLYEDDPELEPLLYEGYQKRKVWSECGSRRKR